MCIKVHMLYRSTTSLHNIHLQKRTNECVTNNCKTVGVKISKRKLCDVIFTDITRNALFQVSNRRDMILLVLLCVISLCDLSLSVSTKNVTGKVLLLFLDGLHFTVQSFSV